MTSKTRINPVATVRKGLTIKQISSKKRVTKNLVLVTKFHDSTSSEAMIRKSMKDSRRVISIDKSSRAWMI